MRANFVVLAVVASLLASSDAVSANGPFSSMLNELSFTTEAAGQTDTIDKRILSEGSASVSTNTGDKTVSLNIMSKLKQIMDSEKAKKEEASKA